MDKYDDINVYLPTQVFTGADVLKEEESPYVLIAIINGTESSHPLKKGINVIGRTHECNIQFNQPQLSRNHAIIEVSEDEVFIKDLGTINCTFRRNKKLRQHVMYELAENVELNFGGVVHGYMKKNIGNDVSNNMNDTILNVNKSSNEIGENTLINGNSPKNLFQKITGINKTYEKVVEFKSTSPTDNQTFSERSPSFDSPPFRMSSTPIIKNSISKKISKDSSSIPQPTKRVSSDEDLEFQDKSDKLSQDLFMSFSSDNKDEITDKDNSMQNKSEILDLFPDSNNTSTKSNDEGKHNDDTVILEGTEQNQVLNESVPKSDTSKVNIVYDTEVGPEHQLGFVEIQDKTVKFSTQVVSIEPKNVNSSLRSDENDSDDQPTQRIQSTNENQDEAICTQIVELNVKKTKHIQPTDLDNTQFIEPSGDSNNEKSFAKTSEREDSNVGTSNKVYIEEKIAENKIDFPNKVNNQEKTVTKIVTDKSLRIKSTSQLSLRDDEKKVAKSNAAKSQPNDQNERYSMDKKETDKKTSNIKSNSQLCLIDNEDKFNEKNKMNSQQKDQKNVKLLKNKKQTNKKSLNVNFVSHLSSDEKITENSKTDSKQNNKNQKKRLSKKETKNEPIKTKSDTSLPLPNDIQEVKAEDQTKEIPKLTKATKAKVPKPQPKKNTKKASKKSQKTILSESDDFIDTPMFTKKPRLSITQLDIEPEESHTIKNVPLKGRKRARKDSIKSEIVIPKVARLEEEETPIEVYSFMPSVRRKSQNASYEPGLTSTESSTEKEVVEPIKNSTQERRSSQRLAKVSDPEPVKPKKKVTKKETKPKKESIGKRGDSLNDSMRYKDPKEKVFLFTGVVMTDRYKRIIQRLGGRTTEDPKEASHLITDRIRRTLKFMCCLAKGIPIVTTAWLEACSQFSYFIGTSSYLVDRNQNVPQKSSRGRPSKNTPPTDTINISTSLCAAQKYQQNAGGIMAHFKLIIFLTNRTEPSPELLSTLIHFCGGVSVQLTDPNIEDYLSDKDSTKLCVADPADLKDSKLQDLFKQLTEFDVQIVKGEFILSMVMQQTWPIEEGNVLTWSEK